MFYYFNGRLPLTNGLLIVPDREVPEGTEKINLKLLYEMFKNTQSHGLVSIQFLCALGIFFGLNISIPKYALMELDKNLSYETLSGARDLEFEAISDLVGEISFQIKNSTLLDIKRKEEQDKESSLDIKKSHDFFGEPKKFEKELKEDLYKDLEHEKIEHPYIEPQVQDAETTEKETKKEDDEFFDLDQKQNEIDNAATELKKQDYFIDLFDDMLDEDNPFNDTMKTEDLFIDDNLFDDTNQKEIKIVSEDVLQDMNIDQNKPLLQIYLKNGLKK